MKCVGGTECGTSGKEASKETEITEERRRVQKRRRKSQKREKDVDDGKCIECNEQ